MRDTRQVSVLSRLRQLTAIDAAMIVLALVSVGLLGWITFADVSRETELRVFYVDVAICAVFAAEFVWRWRENGFTRGFFWRNWYEILGMIPLSHPALRAFRLVRVVILVSRLFRVVDRAAGRGMSERILSKLLGPLVEQIKHPITVAVLDEVTEVLKSGHYTRNVARAMQENHDEMRSMVLEKIHEDQRTSRLASLPFSDRMMQSTTDTTMRIIYAMLEDPRTDELVGDILRENIVQIRADVRRHGVSGAVRPVGVEGSVGSPAAPSALARYQRR